MDAHNQLVIVNGKDKTDAIVSYQFRGDKCDIVYGSSPRVYSYNRGNIRILKLQKKIDPRAVIFAAKGSIIEDINEILDFGDFYRVIRGNRKDLSYRKTDVVISNNCLADEKVRELFEYFKETASAVSLIAGDNLNILKLQYDKIKSISDQTVLAAYLNVNKPIEAGKRPQTLIYPFGLNQSQKVAIENAFSSQVSVIQGPPGTGKTQTILNIIANAVINGKTVAVVSNNNSATSNVAEKLEKKGLSFLTAFLGNTYNKERFIELQTGMYPDMTTWALESSNCKVLNDSVVHLSEELNTMLNSKKRIAEIEREILALKPEMFYFEAYYTKKSPLDINPKPLSKISSNKLLSLWLEYEDNARSGAKIGLIRKLWIAFRFSKAGLALFEHVPEEAVPFIQNIYYKKKLEELHSEKEALENKMRDYQFDAKMKELSIKSMQLFKAELAKRYPWKVGRKRFEKRDFRGNPIEFTTEYPVVLSTTYSIKGTLSTDYIYDYLIVDEASQVDLATGVLAFACAKNIVIVGDQKQLSNVLTPEDIRKADAIWHKYSLDEKYHFATHSMLSSASEIMKDAPSVLLKEHYRCHPKIAEFFNQKFYNGELIVMTEDHCEENVLTMYRTVAGNHMRGHMNQRQVDVIQQEVLPKLVQEGYQDIGIITPYRDQVAAIQRQLGPQFDVATVHKFQGREKEAIILTSVDNIIGSFVDDPNMLNVAVSRAVKSLSVVISNNRANEKTNYGDLAKYIEYNNLEIIESQVYSVFDMLYKGYYAERVRYLKKHKHISEYDSENLAYSVIEDILQMPEFATIDCVVHSSLATLVKDHSLLSEPEIKYASNPLTHLDFLLFNKMDKSPVMAIEVDGTKYHEPGSAQAARDAMKNCILEKYKLPLLRIRTNESNEKERIVSLLKKSLQ